MAEKKTLWFTIKQLELEIHVRTEFREVGEDRAHDKASPVLLEKQGTETRSSGITGTLLSHCFLETMFSCNQMNMLGPRSSKKRCKKDRLTMKIYKEQIVLKDLYTVHLFKTMFVQNETGSQMGTQGCFRESQTLRKGLFRMY